jgi:hypothetical protein
MKTIYDYFTTEHKETPFDWYKMDKLIIPEEDKNMFIFLNSKFDNEDKLNFIVKCIKNNENFDAAIRFLNANKDNIHAMNYIWIEINCF